MIGGIRHVVSESDDMGNNVQPRGGHDEEEEPQPSPSSYGGGNGNAGAGATPESNTAAAFSVEEPEQQHHQRQYANLADFVAAPLTLIQSSGTPDDAMSASSSLSDDNDAGTNDDDDMEEFVDAEMSEAFENNDAAAEQHRLPSEFQQQQQSPGLIPAHVVMAEHQQQQEEQQQQQLHSVPPSPQHHPDNTAEAAHASQSKHSNRSNSYQRMESADSSSGSHGRASSQNSSRDWGWFEDVHQSAHEDVLKLQQHQAKQHRGSGGGKHVTHSSSTDGNDTTGSPSHDGGGIVKGRHSDHHDALVISQQGGGSKPKKPRGLVPQVSGGEMNEIIHKHVENDAAAVTAPNYVLEESLSSQWLWRNTAGHRPPQPVEERSFYERMWAQNFARSQVQYHMPVEVLTATSPISLSPFADGNFDNATGGNDPTHYNLVNNHHNQNANEGGSSLAEAALVSRMMTTWHDNDNINTMANQQIVNQRIRGVGSDGDLIVLVRGDNVFGTTVSKSFSRPSANGIIVGVDTVNISIASYRVTESKKHGKYAQFLVIYREGSIRDTIGVWKRYSDFEELARKVTQAHEGCAAVIANMSPLAVTEEPETEHLPNAITSWRLLKKRQRWYRCLDAGYLSLKVFLLERFLHDILFESSSPKLLRDFVGTEVVPGYY